MISVLPLRFARITGTSPQNSQINWRQAPNGDAFGANGEAISSVFNVAAAEDSAGRGAQRSAHAKIGIWRMRVFSCQLRGGNQGFIFAHSRASRYAPQF